MNLYSIPCILSALGFIFLGIFVLIKSNKTQVGIPFFLFCFASFWWQLSWFILFNITNSNQALLLVKIGYIGIVFIPVTFHHFVTSFLHFPKERQKLPLHYLIGLTFIVIMITTDYFVNGHYNYYWGYYPKANYIHVIYLMYFTWIVARAFYYLFSLKKKSSSPVETNQIRFMIIAGLCYLPASSDFIVNYGFEFYPLGFIFTAIALAVYATAILKYRLMDIDFVLRYGTIRVLYILISSIVVLSLIYLARQNFAVITVIIVGAFSVVLFLYNRTIEYLTPIMMKGKYDYLKKLEDLIQNEETLVTTKDVVQKLFKRVNTIIGVENMLFLMIREDKKAFGLHFNLGLNNVENDFAIPVENKLIELLILLGKPVLKEELEREKTKRQNAILEIMNKVGAEIALPFFIDEILVGILFIGAKNNKTMYHAEDIKKFLQIIKIAERNLAMELEFRDRVLKVQNKYQKHLIDTTKRMVEIRDLDVLSKDVVHILMRSIDVVYAGIYFYNFKKKEYEFKYEKGEQVRKNIETIKDSNYIIKLLRDQNGCISYDDLKRWKNELKTAEIKEAEEIGRKLGGQIIIPIVVDNLLGFVVIGEKRTGEKFSNVDWNTSDLVSYSAAMAAHNIFLLDEVITDELTGLYTKKHSEDQLLEAIPHAIRYNEALSVVMLDVDHFKTHNDTYGHLYGDAVLREIAKCILEEVRPDDIVCRFGGEEFLLILPNTDLEGAKVLAERLRKAVKEKLHLRMEVTISSGIGSLVTEGEVKQYETEKVMKQMVELADKALYKAKETGRDRVCFSESITLKS